MRKRTYPVAGLDVADEPEEDIDVEEEENVGQKKRVISAPCPQRRKSSILTDAGMIMVKEGEVEEN